ncbi:hypothetical protein [Massilia sp.]|uniref:hypothetical protein n=1 Tax=Massilia sp. TaxID=1882437 RepID=UPI00289DE786|nr:hypothetical protein [Massilia sp.]
MQLQSDSVTQGYLQPGSFFAFGRLRLSPYTILFLVSAALLLPIWLIGLPVSGHDALAHVRWQQDFANQLWNGELYPRWLPDLNQGLGSPAFFIYPPLPHYLAAILAPLSDGHAWAQLRLGILAALGFYASGAGAYLWLMQVTRDRTSALLGALVFLVAPYHLFIDMYYRSAYAELWAFTWAPFSLYAVHLFERKPVRAIVIFTLSTAALFLSHAPSCIALPPLYVAYAAVLSLLTRNKSILLWTCAASVAATALAGIYLATALTHQHFIDSSALYAGYFDFFRWLLLAGQRWPRPGAEVGIAAISVVQCGAVFVLGWLMLRSQILNPTQRALTQLSIAGSLAILFLMTKLSAPLWILVPIAQKIQFPWRLLTAQTVLLALVAALYLHWVRNRAAGTLRTKRQRLLLPVLLAMAALNIGLMFVLKPIFSDTPKPGSIDVPEYQMGPLDPATALFAKKSNVRLLAGQGNARVETISPRHLRLHLDGSGEARALLRDFYYPGWECVAGGTRKSCSVQKFNAGTPVLSVIAGPGRGPVDLVLGQTRIERIGEMISLAGLTLMAVLCAVAALLRRPRRHEPDQAA